MRAILFGLLATSGAALAQQPTLVDNVGAWGIYVDQSLGHGCFAMAEYDGGTVFRIGFDRTDDTAYVIVGDDAWQSLEYQEDYPIEVFFGDETPWSVTATGFSFDPPSDEPFLIFWITSADQGELFFQEFMQESEVAIHYRNEAIATLTLNDSAKAAHRILSCQEDQEVGKDDPFADKGKKKRKKDPFGG